METFHSGPPRGRRPAETLWRTSVAALAVVLASSIVVPACSTQSCKDMKGSGSIFGSWLCGAQGDEAPKVDNPNVPNFCSDVRKVMPEFFKLLDRSDKPLSGLREAVKILGQTQCLESDAERRCTEGGICQIGECTNGLCPCTRGFNPLADLLVITFKGLNTVSSDKKNETSTALCATPEVAATLPASQINRLCEVRRLLDVLLLKNGGNKVLDDPAITSVLLALLDYVTGKGYPTCPATVACGPHYDLFTTLGRMANNPGICSPATAYDLLDKLLGWLTPANAVPVLNHLSVLLSDPTMQTFLNSVSSGTGGGSATGRAAVISLLKGIMPAMIAARSGEEALDPVTKLVKQLILDSTSYPQLFKDRVQTVLNDVNGLLCSDKVKTPTCPMLGLWTPLQASLTCLNDPNVDQNGELIGALYDLLSLKSHLPAGIPGVDITTLLNALTSLSQFDPTGQVARTAQMIVRGLRDDEGGTEAVRLLLTEMLTPEIGERLIPPLSTMIQSKVLGEVFTLLADLLYECKQPH